jgi:hypothetical protein
MNAIEFIVSVLVALLPDRYRRQSAWRFVSTAGAVTSGALELTIFLVVLLYRYVMFANNRVFGGNPNVMLAAAERGGNTAIMGTGLFTLAEYMLQPLTVLFAYFVIEGLARLSAAVASGEIVPSLPFQLIAWAHGAMEKKQRERELGPLVEDLVQPGHGEFALVIASCRPKTWTNMTTISYEDKLYELVKEESAQPPRRWVYVLRKRPESKIVRGEIYTYRPDENMPALEAAVATQNR